MTKRECIWKEKNIFLVTHDLQNVVEFKHKSTTSLPLAKRDKKLFWVESRIEKEKNKGEFTNYVDKILEYFFQIKVLNWYQNTLKNANITHYIKDERKKPLWNTLNWVNWNSGFVKLGVWWAERDNCLIWVSFFIIPFDSNQ